MYLHYVETKDKYPHAVLLYRVGDFFECYFQDAVKLAQELELVLTSKQAGEQGRVAMSGVPHHAWERYTTLLVEKGYAVVICDQVEDASEAAGIGAAGSNAHSYPRDFAGRRNAQIKSQ